MAEDKIQEVKEQAQAAAKSDDDRMQFSGPYKLLRPFKFEGEEITELNLDLENISGFDIKAARKRIERSGVVVALWQNSMDIQAELAARASGKPVELIWSLKAPDFAEVCSRVQGFFINPDGQ